MRLYKCRNKIPIVDLEGNQLKEADAAIGAKEELIASLEAERRKVAAEMDKVYQLYLDDKLDTEGFGARNGPLAERQKQIDAELPKLQAELDVMKIGHISQGEVVNEARDLYARWGKLAPEPKRHIVETITETIVIGKDDVSINLLVCP